jgi:multicomponent Na+:H+ antiporter subunit E
VNRLIRTAGPRLVMGLWLMVVWLLLWGRIDPAVVAGGVVVTAAAYFATRLPAAPLLIRIRPWRLAEAVLEFTRDLVVSSVVIAWHAVRAPRRVRGAIVEVGVRSDSELLLLAVTASVSLRPGSLVLDIDTRRSLLLVHGMPIRNEREVDALRANVLRTEHRLTRALPHLHGTGTSTGKEER